MEEIKSSLLNDKDFENVKNSIIEVSQNDGKEKFRVKLIEYINDTSSNDDDEFFYDMLIFTRFLNPSDEAVAYTTPHKLIYLNAPGNKIGEKIRVWDFVYDHECLHQLWDTFGVGNRIKNELGEYNHQLLNIASDCVINDYLAYYRKKDAPDFGITPDVIRKEFNVDYDRKIDTQYTLYMKLLKEYEKNKKQMDEKLKNDPKFNGKLTPGSIDEEPGGGGDGLMGAKKHSDDYRKGWTDAIQDALDKKVDPKTFKPKKSKNDYDNGYNDAMSEMKEGMENGVKLSKGGSGGGGSSDLPEIPWETPPQKSNSDSEGQGDDDSSDNDSGESNVGNMSGEEAAKDAQKSANNAQKAADKAKEKAQKSGSNKDKKKADKAQKAADKAKEAAKQANDAAQNGDTEGAQDAANDARKAANEATEAAGTGNTGDSDINDMTGEEAAADAQNSAKEAQKAADDAKKQAAISGDAKDKEEADLAQKAADKAKKAADKAKKAAKAGKESEAQDAAKEARDALKAAQSAGNDRNENTTSNSSANSTPGHDHIESTLSTADLEAIKEKAEAIIKKYQNKISGNFGEFVAKCKSSVKLQKSGLSIGVHNAAPGWNTLMTTQINTFVKKKVFQKKREIERTYKRINRRQGPIKFGDPIVKGKRIRKDKMTINVAFYIDRSGSMDSSIRNVFDACYKICESLKKQFSKEKVVDEVSFKIFAFDTQLEEVQFGKVASCGGGTMAFHQLLEHIEKRSQDFLINVILTDAEFEVRQKEVCDFVDKIGGMLQFITNNENKEVKRIAEMVKYKTKLFYILANSTFELN